MSNVLLITGIYEFLISEKFEANLVKNFGYLETSNSSGDIHVRVKNPHISEDYIITVGTNILMAVTGGSGLNNTVFSAEVADPNSLNDLKECLDKWCDPYRAYRKFHPEII